MPDPDLFARFRAAMGADFRGFETTVGYRIAVEGEVARIHLEVADHHLNVYGTGHGGVTLTMLDVAGGVQAYVVAQPERMATINLAAQFLDLVRPGPIVATASIDRLGKAVAHTSVALRQGGVDGPLLATAVASYRLFHAR